MLILFFFTQTWSVYLDSSLSYIGLTREDLAFRNDYTPHDPYRFPLVDHLLESPIKTVDSILSLDDMFWNSTEIEMVRGIVDLYGLSVEKTKAGFKDNLSACSQSITDAYSATPHGLDQVFEELTLHSPDLTQSIDEERDNVARSDSLIDFLREKSAAIRYDKLFSAGLYLLAASQGYKEWATHLDKQRRSIEDVEGAVVYYEECEFGDIVIGDTGNNIYRGDFAVLIDLGGDDTYYLGEQKGTIHLLIDESGDDTYEGENYSIACGHFGVSILIDEKGNDAYVAGCYTIGCGVFGLGILIDGRGDDRYYGDAFTQGAGGFGIGILKDEHGNDKYEGGLYAQGFASTYGIGILGDRTGNDMYIILEKYIDEIRYLDHYLSLSQGFTTGFRPDLSAGIGMLLDGEGNDYYLGDIFAQGAGYWYGIGAVVDGSGNDNYVAYQYAQAVGTHIAFGVLIDKQGNDNYIAKGVSQGCGHDLSLGILYDRDGDDSYVAYDLSQGAGNANGIGILIDESGDDNYSVKKTHNTQGYGNFRREYGSVGILLDIKGEDHYRVGRDKLLWKSGKYGIGIDWQ